MIRKRESVHRLSDVKGGTHFAVFPVFLGWSSDWTQLHQSSMCSKASGHRVQVWPTTQPLNSECHSSGTNLGFKWLKNDRPQELNSSGVGNYINSEQRWINREASKASPSPSKSCLRVPAPGASPVPFTSLCADSQAQVPKCLLASRPSSLNSSPLLKLVSSSYFYFPPILY